MREPGARADAGMAPAPDQPGPEKRLRIACEPISELLWPAG